MLSDVVADRVVQLRKAARLSREEFAEQCRQLGGEALADFTAAALTNVETGRRDADGKRRRRVTVEELPVFAAVLGVPLVWLFADVSSGAPVPLMGSIETNPWWALAWMIGAQSLGDHRAEAWKNSASWLEQLSDLYRLVRSHEQMMELYDPLIHPRPPTGTSEMEARRHGLKAIKDRTEGFWRAGLPVPPLLPPIQEGVGELLVEDARHHITVVEERLAELAELRELAGAWIPAEDDEQARRQQAADAADRSALRDLAATVQRIRHFGATPPPVPDAVINRAQELGIEIPRAVNLSASASLGALNAKASGTVTRPGP